MSIYNSAIAIIIIITIIDAIAITDNMATSIDNVQQRLNSEAKTTRRKSSAAIVDELPTAVVEGVELSVADRRLAEMGYVQVRSSSTSLFSRLTISGRSTNASSHGSLAFLSPYPFPVFLLA